LLTNCDDATLIACAQRDATAFGELYRRYAERIYNYIYHRVGDAAEAEDLTARTFHRSLVALPSYVDRGAPFSAWLYRIAHNVVANYHRERERHLTVPLEALGAEADGSSDRFTTSALGHEAVRAAVRRLDADRQALLILKFNQGLSNAEIAFVLGRTESAVKSLYHRTLLELRDRLTEDGMVWG